MSLFSTGPFSYNRFDEMDKAYHKLYEKKAAKDYDGDGKVESGKEEYFGSKDKAIKKAMGKEVKEGNEGIQYPKGPFKKFTKDKSDPKVAAGREAAKKMGLKMNEEKKELPDFIKKKMDEKKKEGCSCKESVDYLLQQGIDLSEYTWKEMEELFYEGISTGAGMIRGGYNKPKKANETQDEINKRLMLGKHSPAVKYAKMKKEEVCEYLIDRGYTNNEVSAEVLFNHMSDEWIEQIIEEG